MSFVNNKQDSETEARAGILSINGYSIKTPILWLGHNFEGPVKLWEGQGVKLPGLLVNACEILRHPGVTKFILEKGIHDYLGYHGPLMMDSGGFLFQKDRKINVTPEKIAEFYEKVKIDIGVALDHPLNPMLPSSKNKKRWERTLRNTRIMIDSGNSCAFMPVVHGYDLNDLKSACRQILTLLGKPDLIGLGSLVPLMKTSHLGKRFHYLRPNGEEGNHITFIADAIKLIRDEFPNAFIHIFGVGGITTILSVFALGADSVDSVAWRLKAAYGAIQLPGVSDRFLFPRHDSPKPRRVINKEEDNLLAKCSCPICLNYERVGWKKRALEASFKARAIHNAWNFLNEVKAFRKAILSETGKSFLRKRLTKAHRLFPLFED